MEQSVHASPRRRRSIDERGFTLIELLVVLVILGLLAALAGPRVVGYLSGAKTDTARLQIRGFAQALDLYRVDTGGYPPSGDGLEALVQPPAGSPGWNGPYLDGTSVPADPWGNPYVYRSPGPDGQPYEVVSLGSDGRPGGQGEAADVTSAER